MHLSFARFLFIIKPISSANPSSNPLQTTLCFGTGILSYVSFTNVFSQNKKRTRNQAVPNFQFSFHSFEYNDLSLFNLFLLRILFDKLMNIVYA